MKIAIVGATGLVGQTMINILEKSALNIEKLVLIASEDSTSLKLRFKDELHDVVSINEDIFNDIDICLMSIGENLSNKFALSIAKKCCVIDNSSRWRLDPDVPLVVPSINGSILSSGKSGIKNIIANPNCVVIQITMALAPLHCLWRVSTLCVATYQSASGAGSDFLRTMLAQSRSLLEGEKVKKDQIAFNVLPNIGGFNVSCLEQEQGIDFLDSEEEKKICNETRKILSDNEINVSATCARVPVSVGHAVAVHVFFEKNIDIRDAYAALSQTTGVVCCNHITPAESVGTDIVYVMRLRKIPGHSNALSMWIVCDNLRKGAALNAIEIAEHINHINHIDHTEKIHVS